MKTIITVEQFDLLLEYLGTDKKLKKALDKKKIVLSQVDSDYVDSLDFNRQIKRYVANQISTHLNDPSKNDIRYINDYFRGKGNVSFEKNKTHEQVMQDATNWHDEQFKIDSKLKGDRKNVFLDLKNGYYWQQLKNSEDCSLEGKMMGHCVGNYGEDVESGYVQIYSLRNSENTSHVTIGIKNDEIFEFKGKNNKPPIKKYLEMSVPFLKKVKWKTLEDETFWDNVDSEYAKFLYKHFSNIFDLKQKIKFRLPILKDDLNYNGNLELENISSLPDNMIISGYMKIKGGSISSLPDNLTIKGGLIIMNLDNMIISNTLNLGGDLSFYKIKNLKIPDKFQVKGHLKFALCDFDNSPNGLIVDRDLHIFKCNIDMLGDNLIVKGNLKVDRTKINYISPNIKVLGNLEIDETDEKNFEHIDLHGRKYYLEGTPT